MDDTALHNLWALNKTSNLFSLVICHWHSFIRANSFAQRPILTLSSQDIKYDCISHNLDDLIKFKMWRRTSQSPLGFPLNLSQGLGDAQVTAKTALSELTEHNFPSEYQGVDL